MQSGATNESELAGPHLCPYCHQAMQTGSTIFEKGKIVSRQFLCACKGTVYFKNVHRQTEWRPEE